MMLPSCPILNFGMEHVGQFIGEPATRGLINEGLNGGDESAVAGKPDCIVGPQAGSVETGGFAEGIVATAMSIAGQVPSRCLLLTQKWPIPHRRALRSREAPLLAAVDLPVNVEEILKS